MGYNPISTGDASAAIFFPAQEDWCYNKHALRADAPIPHMFFSPLVL